MNTDERRALVLLRAEGFHIKDEDFVEWLNVGILRHSNGRTSFPSPQEIIKVWKDEHV